MICFLIQCRYISGHLCILFSARLILSTGDEYYFVKQGKELHCNILTSMTFLLPESFLLINYFFNL